MTEEERLELSMLIQRTYEINAEISEMKRSNPNLYPDSLIKELLNISAKITEYGSK